MTGRAFSGDGIRMEAVTVAPGVRLMGHEHAQPHICCVIEGAFDELVAGRQRHCGAGTTRVSPAGDRHSLDFQDGARCVIVLVDDDCDLDRASRFRERRFWTTPWSVAIARRAFESLGTGGDGLLVESVGWELVAQTERQYATPNAGPPPKWLRRIRETLQAAASGASPSLRGLAHAENVSREHLARAFRSHYGQSPGAFLRSVRLNAACWRLATSDEPIAAIAFDTGFADQSHLTRACVRVKGVTPLMIRRSVGRDVTRIQDFPAEPAGHWRT